MECTRLTRESSVSIISFTRIFFVVNVDSHNVTGSVVRADIFSCIELTMAIVFASVAGIAGREAISNFVDKFIVSKSTNHGQENRKIEGRQRSAGLRDLRLVDSRDWQNTGTSIEESLVSNVEETHSV